MIRASDPVLETVADAQRRLLAGVAPLGAETVLLRQALGRILAETVAAPWALPGFDNSAMDGYAVRAADTAAAGGGHRVTLPVRGESRAGGVPPRLSAGVAIRIMTGAPLPDGADAVVRQEDVDRDAETVHLRVAVAPGTFVRRRGEDMAAGTAVLHAGRALTSVDLGVAAALNRDRLQVGRRPRVGILATGDELTSPGHEVGPAQVIDSNSPMIDAAVREAGGEPVLLGIVGDTRAQLKRVLGEVDSVDLLVSSAGVSVGDHDHVVEVVRELGQVSVWRIAMRPGKPLLIGSIRGVTYLGLPGNPVSSSVTFELFARPAIRALQGAAEPYRRRVAVRLGEAMDKPEGLETYARATLTAVDGRLPVARSSGPQGSAMLRSLADADCLLVLPAAAAAVPAGSIVEAILLR